MTVQYWDSPVEIEFEGLHNQRTIVASCYAFECLKTLWPAWRGPCYRKAVQTCGDAMTGLATSRAARDAFVEAAKESRIFAASHSSSGGRVWSSMLGVMKR